MRVLVIEDEPDLLQSLTQIFREEGYAVDAALDGEEGWFKAQAGAYDAIVLDVMLPKMDGWKLLEKLRARETSETPRQPTPVLMLTARDRTSDRVRGLDSGADDYLVKPFDMAELLARVRALIRRAAAMPTSTVQIGEISIDTKSRLVKRAGGTVSLTAREYALVEYLALRQGEVVTRTTLYEHLFDENESSFSNLLDVHVSNVRKKLGSDFITTRRGHGYSIA
ncbi:MAG TPA: response regulator transcription factor [Verrucomicrobiae bacterium]|nr:response regulator transcription factor [Verrucomicrobiae bacterium]